jgi:cell division protein FtsL
LKNSRKQKSKRRRPKSISRRNLKESLRLLPFIAPLIITAFIYMWQHTRMNIVSISIERLRAKRQDLIKQNDSIRLTIEQLQAPARIESIARKKLRMISPEERQVVALDDPIRPPTRSVETDPQADEGLSSGPESAGLFGFLKKRESPGSISQESSSPEIANTSG